jgi:hypothetical protein
MGKKKVGRVKSRIVWSTEWDTGGMGGGGMTWIKERDGRYWYEGTAEERFGPWRTLERAIKASGINHVNGTTVRIDSPVLSAAEMAALLVLDETFFEDYGTDAEYGLTINGEGWDHDPKTSSFRPAPDEPVVVDREGEQADE